MKYVFRAFVGALALGTVAAGCGDSHTSGDDAGPDITFDATPGTDSGPVTEDGGGMAGDIGEPCSGMGDCDSFCIGESDGFPGGYCTAPCGEGAECPDGSSCTPVGRGMSICLADCEPGAAERSCRAGYGCASSFMIPAPVCLPGCTDDSDCPDGTMCDPDGGFSGAGSCFDPSAGFGDACMESTECPADGFCLEESFAGWPGGACIGFGCDVDANTGCEDDAQCIPSGRGGGLCIDGCETADDCRDGYECTTSDDYPDRKFCGPGCTTDDQCSDGRVCNPGTGTCDVPFDPDELGQPCSTDEDACAGGTCLTEFESGQPGSYCTYVGCDPTLADGDGGADGCPGDGVCVDAGTEGICLDGCADEVDCRADYACVPSDPTDDTSPTACLGACETDDACANDDFECNLGTGLCRAAFDSADIGEPCDASSDFCDGGTCITEADEGWPAGTCAFPGCRLSGDGPAEECGTGAVCVDDGEGDPELGHCLDACDTTSDPSDCRDGYACVADSGTAGSCQPACTGDDDCGGSRTCNTTSGLCE